MTSLYGNHLTVRSGTPDELNLGVPTQPKSVLLSALRGTVPLGVPSVVVVPMPRNLLKPIDSSLSKLTDADLVNLRTLIVDAICDQPSHDDPAFNAAMAYELSVLNWDILGDIAHVVHLYDEWWTSCQD